MKTRQNGGSRKAALNALNRVSGGAYADIVIEATLKGLDETERALATEITYGVLRHMIRLDWIISQFSRIKPAKLEYGVLNALRTGVYQLLFLDRIPASAAINETVNLVKSQGSRTAGFVNAVLRKVDSDRELITWPEAGREPAKYISVYYSHPEWLVKRWIERYGPDECTRLCEANNNVPPKTIRVNTLLNSRDKLKKELSAAGFDVAETRYSRDGLLVSGGPRLEARDKRYYIQDEASQLVSLLLAPEPGATVLDSCAAPGGKTTHMAAMMNNTGVIFAVDKYAGRLKTVTQSARRFGVRNIKTVEGDSQETLELGGDAPEVFDSVLLDAPCSGLGVVRRSPEIKYRRSPTDLLELSLRQALLLANVSGYVKKGGTLVYSVCTFEPEETVDVIDRFLKANKGFELVSAAGRLDEACAALVDERGFLRTYPHVHGTDGFFAACLTRVS